MVSKNNRLKRFEQSAQRQNHFGIRKLTIGAASVLLGTSLYLGTQTSQAKAATVDNNNKDNAEQQSGDDKTTSVQDVDHVEVAKQATTLQTKQDAAATAQSENKAQATEQSAAISDVQNSADAANKAVNKQATKQEEKAVDTKAVKADAQEVKTTAPVENKDANKDQAKETTTLSVKSEASTKDPILQARMLKASLAAAPASAKADDAKAKDEKADDPYSTLETAQNWQEVQNAAATGKAGVTIKNTITASGDLNVQSNFIIHGTDGATLNLNQNKINNTGNLTLADVNVNGSVMGNGTVNIEGNVTSTVNDSNGYTLTNSEKSPGVKTNWNQTKGYNIQATTVNVKEGASLTVNRASIGDGIHLVNSNSSVNVSDNAKLTVNMNTNNGSEQARYHDAGIFAESNGSFTTGDNSVVNFNTSIGQAIAMAGMRPSVSDSDRFGGYGARNRANGSGQINLGQNSTINFTGRDGVILGNNSNFNVGEYANVHFENKGRGVALDLANQSNINIGDHAVTYFHSVGKTGTSGSYDGYNYIGVNEGGNITVGEYATFRVILEGRGDNPWDDVVSLDSQNANTNAAFTSKKGAVIDIRDDNTNFYAELISFPLGSSKSRIDIQDPLLLNLQRYSKGGATTGWMPTGGDMINTTSAQYTSNLIYMSGTNGVFSVSGGDYDPSNPNSSGFVVYQQIKSDGSKQIWLNVNDVNIPMNGFQTKDIWNNQANPDVSITGNGLTGGIKANQVHNTNGSPLTGTDAPYYGISTQRASHQIWIPHRAPLEVSGHHTNTIKYVDEQGNEIFPENTSSLNLKRNIILDITQDQIKKIQDYALSHTADETLEYIKNSQSVAQDSGWKLTDVSGQTVTDPYAEVVSPVKDGYTATIQSTNVPGLKAGEDASSVTAKFAVDPSKDMVQNGELSDSYKENGITGIPDNYVTVVVYKKAAEKGSVKVVYHDDTTNTDIPNTQYDTGSVDAGTKVDYTTSKTISDLEKKGYVYVSTDGTIPTEIEGNNNVTVTVHMKHGTTTITPENPGHPDQPINPNDPDPNGPKWPNGTDAKSLTKQGSQTIHYVYEDGTKAADDSVQNTTFEHTLVFDNVTGKQIEDKGWNPASHKFNDVTSPTIDGYHADKTSVNGATVTPENPTSETTVTYVKNGSEVKDAKHLPASQTVKYVDEQGNELHPEAKQTSEFNYSGDTVDKVTGQVTKQGSWDQTSHRFTAEDVPVIDGYVAVSGYTKDGDKVVAGGFTATNTGSDDDRNKLFTVVYKKIGNIVPVGPDGKTPIPDPTDPSKNVPNKPYVNDPTDPTKVTPNEPVPNIPGYTPSQDTVTPPDPTKDTPVIYTKNVADETVKVKYIDDTTGENHTDLSSYDKSITAKPGEALNYTTNGSIAEIENKGYKLVSDGFTAANLNDKMPEKGGTYEVHFVHNTTTITPENPGDPGQPINPNDPDPNGPKWPNGTDAKSLTKQGNQTIHYVYSDGTKAADDSVQNTTFEHTLVFDNVTGKQIEDKGWNPASHKFNDVTSPTIDGYHADKTSVNGATVTIDNPTSETTVTYVKNDTEIRNHQEVKASQLVKYVDEQGNEVAASKNQDFTFTYTGDTYDKETGKQISTGKWVVSSHDFTSEDVPVVDGYVAVKGFTRDDNNKVIAGGFTTTPDATDAQRNRTFTVVYKKVGKIVPVDPSHTPIPNVPTPSYPNDPTDPTKVTPDEPVPTIPGYTPSQNTVTPPDPTKDTPVVYTKNEAGLKVEYIDQDANNAILKSDNVDGKIGDKITYTTASSIADFTNQGYELVSDGFTGKAGEDFSDANNGKTYQVILKHGTRPVTPDQPGAGYDKTDLQKDITRTVHFINSQTGEQVADPVTQTVHFEATGTVDKVTGKLVTVKDGKITGEGKLTWTPAQDLTAVTSPAVDGMHITYVTRDADGTNVKAVSLTHNDSSYDVYVNYVPNGTKTENGKEIPSSQTIKFVDEEGNTLRENNVQTGQFTRTPDVVDATTGKTITEGKWNETSHKFDTINVPVIDGYVATVKTAGGLTATTDNPNVVTEVVYKKVGKIVPVDPTGKPIPNAPTPSYPNDPTDPTKVTPNEPVPTIPGYTPEVPTVTPDKPTEDTPVIYHPVDNTQHAQVIYRDVQDGANTQLATSGDLTGEAGSEITYSTADTIKQLTDKGYVLKNDGFPAGAVFDNDTSKNQVFYVDFIHGQAPVNPDHPHDGIDPSQYSKDVKETVHYVGAGEKTPADNVQNSKWTRTLTVDTVTGKLVENGQYDTDWSIAKGEKTVYDQVNTPVIEGYHADKANVAATAVTQDDISVTVTYSPNGKIVPVDPTGKPIPNVPTPQYPTDPTDPTKVTPDEPVPSIPGYKPEVPTVTPTDPGKDTPVIYTPETPAKDQNAVVNYVDADANNKQIATSGNLSGKAGEKIDYSTKTTISDLEKQGYVLVNDGFPAGATYDNDDKTTQTYTVVLRHGTQPVNPTTPGKPGEPINPDDPNGPKYPQGSDQVTKDVTRTIEYVDENGNKLSDPVNQTVKFTAEGVLDKVTGEWTTPLSWSSSQDVNGVKSPFINGYHLVSVDRDQDGNNVKGVTLSHENNSYTVTVKYAKNGKIVPVDPTGKPIPNVPTPQYPTDPTDPSKVTPNEPVPTIPGYTPEVPTVTPTDPGKDTPVIYTPVVVKDQNAVVNYIDADENNALITSSGTLTGKADTKIDYSTKSTIDELEKKGYVLVNDGFPAGATFDNDDNTTQTYTVILKHGTTTVTPDQPGKPGEPVDPNNPDGPKYPDGTDEKSVVRTGSQTIHYVGAGDKTPKDNVQNFVFTRTITFDNVTGKITVTTPWNVASHTFGSVDTPVVEGYHADKRSAGNQTITPDDLNKTVTVNYTANGKIVPVDPTGKPIPNVPTPQYPTDPTDPTKVTPDEPVPSIPGYTPEVPTVTPTDPGKDTPVHYTPDTQSTQGKVSYIDDTTGKTLKTDDLKGNVGDKINYTTSDKIKSFTDQGYELVSNNFKDGSETFAKNGNDFEVHLKHATTTITPDQPGKPGEPINPNDPNGPKWGDNTDAKHLRRTGTQTVHYQGAGSNTPADNVTTVVFDHSLTIDKVTGETVKDNGWTPASQTYTTVTTPQINGYTASVDKVGGDTVKSGDDNINRSYTVTYTATTPDVPVNPDTPQPQPEPTPTPTPDPDPDIPAPHGEDVPTNPDEPAEPEQEPDIPAPHGEDMPEPEEPVAPQPQAQPQVQPTATNEEPAPAPHASELPQTGSNDDTAAAVAGASIALIGLTGLMGAAKRRRKN